MLLQLTKHRRAPKDNTETLKQNKTAALRAKGPGKGGKDKRMKPCRVGEEAQGMWSSWREKKTASGGEVNVKEEDSGRGLREPSGRVLRNARLPLSSFLVHVPFLVEIAKLSMVGQPALGLPSLDCSGGSQGSSGSASEQVISKRRVGVRSTSTLSVRTALRTSSCR